MTPCILPSLPASPSFRLQSGSACTAVPFSLSSVSKGKAVVTVPSLQPLTKYRISVQPSASVRDGYDLPLLVGGGGGGGGGSMSGTCKRVPSPSVSAAQQSPPVQLCHVRRCLGWVVAWSRPS